MNMTNFPDPASICSASQEMIDCCKRATLAGLMTGFNGNISARLTESCVLISGSGVPKGELKAGDMLFIDMEGEVIAGTARKSSESGLHLALYRECPSCSVILHTHPAALLALQGCMADDWPNAVFKLPFFEADFWRKRMACAGHAEPGSSEVSQIAVKAFQSMPESDQVLPLAIWLEDHGLCAMAASFRDAFGISTQLEHLAGLQLKILDYQAM